MRARIVKKDDKIVVLKTEKEKFIKVPRKSIDFDFKTGDWVTIEKNEDEVYILPQDSSDFWDSKESDEYQESDNFAVGSLICNSLGIVASFLNLWNIYAGLIWAILAISGLLLAIGSKTKKSSAYKAARVTMWISLLFYLVMLVIVLCTTTGLALNGGKGLLG